MKNTYIVEMEKMGRNDVFEYCYRLNDAKRIVVKNFDLNLSILVTRGSKFGEGQHTFRYTYNASKLSFKRIKLS